MFRIRRRFGGRVSFARNELFHLFRRRPRRCLGLAGSNSQVLSDKFARWEIPEKLRNLSRRTIFRELFPIRHTLMPIGILTGSGWELAALHLISKSSFLVLSDDHAIRSAHMHNHGVTKSGQFSKLQLASLVRWQRDDVSGWPLFTGSDRKAPARDVLSHVSRGRRKMFACALRAFAIPC